MYAPTANRGVKVPGLIDGHTHLLSTSAGIAFPWDNTPLREFHEQVGRAGTTPMDILEPPFDGFTDLAAGISDGLSHAAELGLVEVTEMGMRGWWYLDALRHLQAEGPLPVRVRIYLASGLADAASLDELEARRREVGPWVSIDGIKFYGDGWLRSRTCAMCQKFEDDDRAGVLFTDASSLARRIDRYADGGWRIATHAIGDRAIKTVLDAYELVWGRKTGSLAACGARLEHASLQSRDLAERVAESGVLVCVQPSFAVTDASQVESALGPERAASAYPWNRLCELGARLIVGTDYPIEVLEPLVGLARLVNGRSQRPGFETTMSAPEQSRLGFDAAFSSMSDESAGITVLSHDPRRVSPDCIDEIVPLASNPSPFRSPSGYC